MKYLPELTDRQRHMLVKLWFVYGNHGKFATNSGHKFIQRLLDRHPPEYHLEYSPPDDVTEQVNIVLNFNNP